MEVGKAAGVVGALTVCVAGSLSCGPGTGPIDVGREETAAPGVWEAFAVSTLEEDRARTGASFYEALSTASLEMGILHVGVDAGGRSVVHAASAVYQVLDGTAVLATADTAVAVEPGSVVFVRGGVDHDIRPSGGTLDVLVVRSSGAPGADDPPLVSFSRETMVAERDGERNVWTPLLLTSTIDVAMYMLPKNSSDVAIQNHDYDELKIVVGGGGRFDLGDGGFEVEPGSIAYIEHGTRHQFRRTSDALDVLVVAAN